MEIDLAFINEVEECREDYETIFLQIIETTLKLESIECDVEVSCIICDNEKIHEINATYRQIDRPTDVISFALEDSEQYYVEGQPRSLGDIFISYDKAIFQAKEYGHDLKREMCFLFTHGLLHLLGYDHIEKSDEEIMIKKQTEILNERGINR